jgi:hypothetical protein
MIEQQGVMPANGLAEKGVTKEAFSREGVFRATGSKC